MAIDLFPSFEGCNDLCQVVGLQGPNVGACRGGKELLVFKQLAFGLSTTDGGVCLLDRLFEAFVGGGSRAYVELLLGKELAGRCVLAVATHVLSTGRHFVSHWLWSLAV